MIRANFPTLTFLGSLSLALSLQAEEMTSPNAINTARGYLPSQRTIETLQSLEIRPRSPELSAKPPLEFQVIPRNVPENQRSSLKSDGDGKASLPFAVPNAMILQFREGTSKTEIDAFLRERNARVISVQEHIGSVQIEANLEQYFKPRLGDNSVNDVYLRGLSTAIQEFKSDDRVENAAPDFVLRKRQAITNLLTPSNRTTMSKASERTDWGIKDIQADALWAEPGAADGVIIGVMDIGFARHEDLVFAPYPPAMKADDHGNHVAGIACGRHNGVGIRGVLPNCFVRPKSADVYPVLPGGSILGFSQTFGQILAALNEFIPHADELKTFNVSLGYNWMPNFGVNPDEQSSGDWRGLVASQGEIFISVLSIAKRKDMVIFLAAGNDSNGLPNPIDSKFASPMNWAAIAARERGLSNNGVIVEAHDKQGDRASFSNEKGHLSCPGVDIASTVAFDDNGNPAGDRYAEMSGTSMASPYCAAGLALLSLVRPKYTATELVDCIIQSGDKSNSGTPMMRLSKALTRCPPRT